MPLFPENMATEVPIKPTFEFETGGSTQWTLQIATNPEFQPVLTTKIVDTMPYTLNTQLELLTTYYWRIKGNHGCSDYWSEVFNFTTADLDLTCVRIGTAPINPIYPTTSEQQVTIQVPYNDVAHFVNVYAKGINGAYGSTLRRIVLNSTMIYTWNCGLGQSFDLHITDTATAYNNSCPLPTITKSIDHRLSAFGSRSMLGKWTIFLNELTGEIAFFEEAGLELCVEHRSGLLAVSTDRVTIYKTATPATRIVKVSHADSCK